MKNTFSEQSFGEMSLLPSSNLVCDCEVMLCYAQLELMKELRVKCHKGNGLKLKVQLALLYSAALTKTGCDSNCFEPHVN